MRREFPHDQRGVAVVIALLIALLISAIAGALVMLTTTETLISASFRQNDEAAYGAEAALERGLHDLATMPNWSPALTASPANATSSFNDGESRPVAPDGRVLDLARLTAARQRESDERYRPAVFGADTPQWRLFAHDFLRGLLNGSRSRHSSVPGGVGCRRRVRWRRQPEIDSNGQILIYAVALGAGGARQSVQARVGRAEAGQIRLLAWRNAR